MNRFRLYDDISLDPIRADWAALGWKTLRSDLFAGITVALLTLPQTMAYALLAGLPLSCGIFAAIFSAMMASAWGASRLVAFGPTNAIAILIQVGTAEILFTHYRDLTGVDRDLMALQLLTQLTFLVALFQLLGAAFRLGSLIRFVSQSVIVGYLLGVAAAVVITQMYVFMGVETPAGYHSFYDKAAYLLTNLSAAHPQTLCVGMASLALLLGVRRFNRHLPAGLIMLVTISLVVNGAMLLEEGGFFGLLEPSSGVATEIDLVGDTGIFDSGGAGLQLPSFNWRVLDMMVPFAFAVALLSILESSSVARTVSAKERAAVSTNQDVFALGLGNMVSAFMGAMPISASPSRTAVNYEMGARTRLSSVFSALCVALLVSTMGSLVSLVPLAALSALLLVAVRYIVDLKQLRLCFKATPSDAFVMAATVGSCLLFSLDTAFYIGVALSIILYLRKAAIPQVAECTITENGLLHPITADQQTSCNEIRFVKVEGELFFGAADLFHAALRTFVSEESPTRILVIQLRNARDMDATACLALRQLYESLSEMGKYLVLCGMTPSVMRVINDSGLAMLLGPDNLFPLDRKAHNLHMHKALSRAQELIALERKPEEEEGFLINEQPDRLTQSEVVAE